MKNDLIYQSSEYDCGPTCLTNAIRYLFEREEILPGLLKQIWLMGNDTYCDKGCIGCHGTSKAAMRYMADWFTCYAKGWHFPIGAEFLENEQAEITPDGRAWQCLQKGGCAVMRCTSGGIPHYVLLTVLLPEGEIGLFDPYDEEPDFKEPGRRTVYGKPKEYNRAVRCDLLNLQEKADYAMGAYKERELLLIWRTRQKSVES